MKEAIISTERVNSYGSRVLTAGIDLTQYEKNPVLLYMHRRGKKEDMPIGIMTNLRVEGNVLYGTPKFDDDTEDERNISKKWERGTLRMLSAGLDVLEWSEAPEHLEAGQTRPTVTRSKLIEVSVVDIGSNDDALQVGLYHEGKLLTLAAGEESEHLPLLKKGDPAPADNTEELTPKNNPKARNMKEIMMKLGLPEDATEQQAVDAIARMQSERDNVNLARITETVEAAIADRRLTADKKEKYINLGKSLGLDQLKSLLADMTPAQKPLDLVRPGAQPAPGASVTLKWETATAAQLAELRDSNRDEYVRLYKEHYGFAPEF